MPRFREPFEAGDVVWGPDAYHDDDPMLAEAFMRPWLVVSNATFPGHGDQYICCALTSGSAVGPGFVRLKPDDWEKGGTRKSSSVDTETVVTMKHRWITDYSGRLRREQMQPARKLVRGYLT